MIMTRTRLTAILAAAIVPLALAACDRNRPEPAQTPRPAATPEEKVSIFRPEAEVVPVEAPLGPLEASVSFAEGGSELSDAAKAQLATILQSEQMKAGGQVTLRGHTDSTGDDEANLRASRRRAEAVRDYLVEKGVEEDRIEVIPLGEMRPAAPNANLDGTPDEAGRAANRRVDVTIALPGAPSPADDGEADEGAASTLVEAIAESD
ncbi:OmpA family protein [Allopontixanthobacter sp.]|uniref:OmpA family protein n=1 Tax=Allopontixanthobacter sp. TaxID=2906452 RepID=UPI002ABC12BD|nr:OmpA family protein [Allopontixanthobacter sp.]MDZ4307109.1 OmpA family protein [Allopontixanthobacter sp.]